MGLMQISVQFTGISVTIPEVLYVIYIIITSVHQSYSQPRTQGLSSWGAKTLVDAGHVIC